MKPYEFASGGDGGARETLLDSRGGIARFDVADYIRALNAYCGKFGLKATADMLLVRTGYSDPKRVPIYLHAAVIEVVAREITERPWKAAITNLESPRA